MIDLSKEEFHQWLHSAATQKVFEYLRRERDQVRDGTAYGGTLNSSAEVTHMLTAKNVGYLGGLEFVLNLKFPNDEKDD
jgi:DNA-directed RNA polymerase specialized sigma24 family protein